jgi:hypothetical protein
MNMKKNIYETDNLSLCPFLQMNGLKYREVRKERGKNKFVFIFEDETQIGTDLAMAFLKSKEFEYKKFWSFFRNELAKAGVAFSADLEDLRK